MGNIINPYRFGGGGSSLLTNISSYWRIDEASGTRFDSAGSNNLTDFNTVGTASGKISALSARFIAANSEHLDAASNSTLDASTQLSVSFWMYFDTSVNGGSIGTKWDYAVDGSWAFRTGSGYFLWNAASSATSFACSMQFYDVTRLMTTGTWYHIVFVFDGSLSGDANRAKLYLNAVSLDQQNLGGSVPSSLLVSTVAYRIGYWDGIGSYLDARLCEYGFWKNRALSQANVTTLYNSGTGITYPF